MEDILTQATRLNRPALLVRTARYGMQDYNRVVHLRRLLKAEHPPGPSQALVKLIELESLLNTQRRDKRAEYSVARHVECLAAIMCEAQILKASRATKARSAAVAV